MKPIEFYLEGQLRYIGIPIVLQTVLWKLRDTSVCKKHIVDYMNVLKALYSICKSKKLNVDMYISIL